MNIIITTIAKGDRMKRFRATALASALLLSLGATLSGCGYIYRTLPDGYYPVDTGVKIYRTDKYGNRTGQAYAVEDDKVYQTDRYGNRTGQAYEVEGEKVYQTDKYGNRRGQAYAVEGDKVYPTDQFGNRRGQAYEVKD
jgi:hypothetical protein